MLVIVEGPSDASALERYFVKYFDSDRIVTKIIHGDITTDKNIDQSKIKAHLGNKVKSWITKDKFDGIISCHELKTFKHIIYNDLESYFGSTPKTTLLFEDAEAPLSIATKIGIQTVAVQHDLNEGTLFSYDQLIVTNH